MLARPIPRELQQTHDRSALCRIAKFKLSCVARTVSRSIGFATLCLARAYHHSSTFPRRNMDTPVDRIEKFLRPLGHQKWGFIIYRTTYTSEMDFRAMISRIKDKAAETLKHYGADERPIVQHLVWTIIEDRDRLDGTSKTDVRRIFDEWVQSPEAAAEQPNSVPRIPDSVNARYRYAVQIDQASLESFTKGDRDPFVNLIMRNWPYWPEEEDDDDGDEEEGDADEGCEPIDGCIEEDVGWCRVGISLSVPSAYSELCGPNAWYSFYQRPPTVV